MGWNMEGTKEEELKGGYINFEKEEYTLPEIIDLIAEYYDICVYQENKKTKRRVKNRTYSSIYQFIKRKLEDEIGDDVKSKDSTGRKTKFPVEVISKVINCEQGAYFTYLASQERQKELNRYGEQAKKLRQEIKDGICVDFESELNEYRKEMRSTEHEAERYIESMFRQRKFDILMDIVFNHLIILDEAKLRTDLSIALTFGDNDPDVKDMEAMDHLSNNRNYYKWRTEELKALFSD